MRISVLRLLASQTDSVSLSDHELLSGQSGVASGAHEAGAVPELAVVLDELGVTFNRFVAVNASLGVVV